MTQGDDTHYHSREWWQAFTRSAVATIADGFLVEPDGDHSAGTPDHNKRADDTNAATLRGALTSLLYVHTTCGCEHLGPHKCARCRAVSVLGFDPAEPLVN